MLWMLCGLAGAAPPSVLFGTAADRSAVDVPLVRGGGDPRPLVEVRLGEREPPLLAAIDLGGQTVRVGLLLAIRRGIPLTRDGTSARIDALRIGEVVLNRPRVEIVPGDELVIGAGALPETGTAVLPSRGTVRFAEDPEALLAGLGAAIPLEEGAARWWERGERRTSGSAPAIVAEVDGEPVRLRLRTDRARSSLAEGTPEQLRGGSPAVWARIRYLGLASARWWPVDESLADPRPDVIGELGADALASLDLAVDPRARRLAARAVAHPRWTDAVTARRALLEAEAVRWERPALPSDDALARSRWGDLARLRFEDGDLAGAAEADASFELVAAERCEAWLALAERRLRAGGDPIPALDRAIELYGRWFSLEPRARDRARRGRGGGPSQPVSCERAAGLRALLGGAPVPFDDLDPGRALATARALPPAAAEAALRSGIVASGGRRDIGLRNALAAAQAATGRTAPAARWAVEVARSDDPHPLTTAWVLGPELVAAAVEAEPGWLAGRLLLAAHGAADLDLVALVAEAEDLWVRRPGDPAARCARALADALSGGGEAAIPERPEADCLAAKILLARAVGDEAEADASQTMLARRWPDLVPAARQPPAEVPAATPRGARPRSG